VKGSILQCMQAILDRAPADELRKGADVDPTIPKYSKLVLQGVWTIHNDLKDQAYKNCKEQIRADMRKLNVAEDTVTELQAVPNIQAVAPLDHEVNEKILLHGTKADKVLKLVKKGFDERLNSRGLFGWGVYLAENAAKIDQYTTPEPGTSSFIPATTSEDWANRLKDELFNKPELEVPTCELHFMLVCKALLGCPVHTKDGQTAVQSAAATAGSQVFVNAQRTQFVNVPDKLLTAPEMDSGYVRYHSLVAELGEKIQRFREFLVVKGDALQPIYLVAYRRQ